MRTIFIFYSLLCALLTEGAGFNIEGDEWGQVSFQCSHKFASKNDKYFCKYPCKKDEDILVKVSAGKRGESGRITLEDSGDGVFTVIFKNLQLSDSQEYYCAVARPGFDTYTSVHLSVHKAIGTTSEPVISSTWTYLNVANATQLTASDETSKPTNLSAAANSTIEGEQNISSGTVVYATVGTAAILAILLLAMRLRKCRESLKSQPHVCSKSKTPSNAKKTDEKKVDCDRQDPQISPTRAECRVDMAVYENISFFNGSCGTRNSPKDRHDLSRTYINPLPSAISGKKTNELIRKHPCETKRQESTESCTSKASLCPSTSSRSTGPKPSGLWFGLDVSKVNQS